MGVGVAREEQYLKAEHAGRPHRRAAAEPGQDETGEERLDEEEEERREENRRGVSH
jgi:hypothetical protein